MLDFQTEVMSNGKYKGKLPDDRIPTEDIVGTQLWNSPAGKQFRNKKRKYDQPLKAKKPLMQNKNGKIVKNNITQTTVDDLLDLHLNAAQEIPKSAEEMLIEEKKIINISDTSSSDNDAIDCDKYNYRFEMCEHCGLSIIHCLCMASSESGEVNYETSSEFDCGSDCDCDSDSDASEDLMNI